MADRSGDRSSNGADEYDDGTEWSAAAEEQVAAVEAAAAAAAASAAAQEATRAREEEAAREREVVKERIRAEQQGIIASTGGRGRGRLRYVFTVVQNVQKKYVCTYIAEYPLCIRG